jgi:hypothetical protein
MRPPSRRPDSDPAPSTPSCTHAHRDTAGDVVKRRKDSEPSRVPGPRPPEYVIVVAASDWVKERYPDNRFNLWDALHTAKDPDPEPQPDPEPDMEAEP